MMDDIFQIIYDNLTSWSLGFIVGFGIANTGWWVRCHRHTLLHHHHVDHTHGKGNR